MLPRARSTLTISAVQHPAVTRSATHAVFPTGATHLGDASGAARNRRVPEGRDGSWRSWGRRSGVDRQEVRAESRQQAALDRRSMGVSTPSSLAGTKSGMKEK